MNRHEKIFWILNNLFDDPDKQADLWSFFEEFTDSDLDLLVEIQELDDAGFLTNKEIGQLRELTALSW